MNVLKKGYKPVEKVYVNLDGKASDVYSNTDMALFYSPEYGYALGRYDGTLIDTCGSSWEDVNNYLHSFSEEGSENE